MKSTLEINFHEPEAFALVVQSAVDGDRIVQAQAQRQAARIESEKLQTEFPINSQLQNYQLPQ